MNRGELFFTSGKKSRMKLRGDHYERIFTILEADISEPVQEVVEFLRGSVPKGNHWDTLGASMKQLAYIVDIAGFSDDEVEEFLDVLGYSGGLSMAQAGHLIDSLKPYMKEKRELQALMNPEIDPSRMKPTDALVLLGLYELGRDGEMVLTSDLVDYVKSFGAVNRYGDKPLSSIGSFLLRLREKGLIVHNKLIPPLKAKGYPGQKSSAILAPGVMDMIETGDILEELRVRAEETRRRRDIPTG